MFFLALWLSYMPYAVADSAHELVNTLVAKGILTEDEGAKILKRENTDKADKATPEKQASSGTKTNVQIRGYVQNRNTVMVSGDKGVNLWSDRSVGDDTSLGGGDKNFLIRRARVIFFGDVGDHLGFYIQPDLASTAGTGNNNFAQLRDAYGDVFLIKPECIVCVLDNQKSPLVLKIYKSSQNRLGLDRADALNSAVRDERDIGAFYYYTPQSIQAIFDQIQKDGLKHSGNYGMLGLGLYNGQGANRSESNDNYHWVARASYPWQMSTGQFYEAGIQMYRGNYDVSTAAYRNSMNTSVTPQDPAGNSGYKDERIGLSFAMYPQPFGFQAEWNWGTTPGLDLAQNKLGERSLNGGYIQTMYMLKDFHGWGTFIPFVRWQYFNGANKAETNAPSQ